MTRLGPKVLPLSEQLLFAANLVARKLLGPKKVQAYVPDFGLAFDHICLHTGEIPSHLSSAGLLTRGSYNWPPMSSDCPFAVNGCNGQSTAFPSASAQAVTGACCAALRVLQEAVLCWTPWRSS